MKKLSRNEVKEKIRPESEFGDRSVYYSFCDETKSRSRKLTREEVKSIILDATDDPKKKGIQFSKNEFKCLEVILDYEHISDDGFNYLANFIYMKRKYCNVKKVKPIFRTKERIIIDTITSASGFPYKFSLPDKPYIYKFQDLVVVTHGIKDNNVIPLFFSKIGSRGVYNSGKDCLLLKEDYCNKGESLGKSTLIHESFHVLQDAKGFCTDTQHTESAAHLAQAIWLISKKIAIPSSSHKRLKHGFEDIAKKIIEATHKKSIYKVSTEEYKKMRKELALHSKTYKAKMKKEKKLKRDGWTGHDKSGDFF